MEGDGKFVVADLVAFNDARLRNTVLVEGIECLIDAIKKRMAVPPAVSAGSTSRPVMSLTMPMFSVVSLPAAAAELSAISGKAADEGRGHDEWEA